MARVCRFKIHTCGSTTNLWSWTVILQDSASSEDDDDQESSEKDVEQSDNEEESREIYGEASSGSEGSDDDEGEEDEADEMSEEDEEEERTVIRKELSSLSFAELEALKSKIGTKEWNEAMFGSSSAQSSKTAKKRKMKTFKRESKNRPREVSAKIKPKRVREVVPVKKTRRRDPRFEDLCGTYDEKIWSRNYDFITDMRKNEIEDMKKKLQDESTEDQERYKIKKTLQKMANKERSDKVKKDRDEKTKKEREENIQRLKEGKKPYFMKKTTKKFVELADKYDELKASGKLDSYLKKKRKKNAVRDRKTLPSK